MLKNYIKIAYRTLLKHKLFTALNLVGLSLSLVSCLLIYRFVSYHHSFDDFHAKADQIYRVVAVNEHPTGLEYEAETPYPLGEAMKSEFPEIQKIAQIHAEEENVIKAGEEKFKENEIIFANSDYLDVFNFKILKGDSKKALDELNKTFLTEKLAEKYFGNDNPLGEVITFGNGLELSVVGIIQDPPDNTHIPMSMIISYPTLKEHYKGYGFDIEEWGLVLSGYTYALIPKEQNPEAVELEMTSLVEKYYAKEKGEKRKFKLQALTDIHLSNTFTGGDLRAVVNPTFLKVISLIGIFILVIACINFVNMATALAQKRAREVGIRKVIGAGRGQLIVQFMGEVILIVSIAVVISYGLAELLGSYLEHFMDASGEFGSVGNDIAFLVAILFTVSLLSGLYPALVISAYQPLASLKGNTKGNNQASLYLRRGLVVLQFTISVALIIGTIVVSQQLQFFKGKDLGFRKEAVLLVDIPKPEEIDFEAFKSQLNSHSFIKNVSFNLGAPTSTNNISTTMKSETLDGSTDYQVALKIVDNDYLETFDLKLTSGRWFTKAEEEYLSNEKIPAKEKDFKFVVNETLAKTLGYSPVEAVLGSTIQTGFGGIKGEVIGVVGDFNIRSLHHEVEPVIMHHMPSFCYQAAFSVQEGRMTEGVSAIEAVWSKTFPESVFEYKFLDEEIENLYKAEQKTSFLFKIFSTVAIVIGCMGLFGLSAFMTTQRTKEVGVRKVLGASLNSILSLLSREILILIAVANAIAIPVAWISLNKWLENFPYRIKIGVDVFLLAAFIGVAVALLTVSYQTIKAALANPVESLKND